MNAQVEEARPRHLDRLDVGIGRELRPPASRRCRAASSSPPSPAPAPRSRRDRRARHRAAATRPRVAEIEPGRQRALALQRLQRGEDAAVHERVDVHRVCLTDAEMARDSHSRASSRWKAEASTPSPTLPVKDGGKSRRAWLNAERTRHLTETHDLTDCAGLTQFRGSVKQAPVLGDRRSGRSCRRRSRPPPRRARARPSARRPHARAPACAPGSRHVAREQVAHDLLGVGHDRHHARVPVDVGEQELLEALRSRRAIAGEKRDDRPAAARTPSRLGSASAASRARVSRTSVVDHGGDHAPDRPRRRARRLGIAGAARPPASSGPASGTSTEIVERDEPGAQAVVEVVGVVGDVVGERRHLRLRRRPSCELERAPVLQATRHLARTAVSVGPPASGPLCLARPSSVSQVRLSPSKPAYLRSSRVTTRRLCALWSKPP